MVLCSSQKHDDDYVNNKILEMQPSLMATMERCTLYDVPISCLFIQEWAKKQKTSQIHIQQHPASQHTAEKAA
jgi:hypothetical protein